MATSPSPARQLANAANSRHSTGPRTDPGKARSSQNARTHGLTAKHLNLGDQEREEFEQLVAEYRADIRPQGPVQETMFRELVLAAWNLLRVEHMEAAICALEPDPLKLVLNEDLLRKLERLAAYRARIHSAYHRSLRSLTELQTSLAMTATLPPQIVGIMPPLASAAQLAKRTQHITRPRAGRSASGEFDDSDLADIAFNATMRANRRLAEQQNQRDTAAPLAPTA
jgi:hypothetical protein